MVPVRKKLPHEIIANLIKTDGTGVIERLAMDVSKVPATFTAPGVGDRQRVLVWFWGRRGGGARYTMELTRALAKQPSLEVHTSLSRQSELFAETKGLGLPGFEIDTFSNPFSALCRTIAVPKISSGLVEYLENNRIEMVLCTMRHVWNTWAARLVRSTKRRYVVTIHDAVPHCGDQHPGWRRLLLGELSYADGVVALSKHVRGELVARYSYPESRIWTLPHGPFRFPGTFERERAAVGRPRRLLFFGRILPYKGLPLLLDAFHRIGDRHDLELAVVGRGELSREMSGLLKRPRIRLENRWVPESEVADVFARADLVVAPYLEASQSGVIAAAYGMGLPVVVTPVGGLREQVIPKETGMIAAEIAPAALAEAISALCADPSLYARCRDGARQAGEMEKSWGAIAERFTTVFNEVRAIAPMSPFGRPDGPRTVQVGHLGSLRWLLRMAKALPSSSRPRTFFAGISKGIDKDKAHD